MEKVLISLVYIILNVGLYFVFVLSDKLNIRRVTKIIFFLIFLAVSVFWVASDNPNFQLIRITISLLGLYLLGSLVLLFISKYLEQKNAHLHKKIKQVVLFIVLPLYTLFVTTVQALLLFSVI